MGAPGEGFGTNLLLLGLLLLAGLWAVAFRILSIMMSQTVKGMGRGIRGVCLFCMCVCMCEVLLTLDGGVSETKSGWVRLFE